MKGKITQADKDRAKRVFEYHGFAFRHEPGELLDSIVYYFDTGIKLPALIEYDNFEINKKEKETNAK